MLKNFIYLNELALNGYLSALEDGLRGAVEAKVAKSSSVSGKAGVAGVGIGGDHERQYEETTSRTDTAAAKFERLQRLARQDVEASGWIDVVNPDIDLTGLGTGALIELEREIYVPEIVKALSPTGGLAKAIGQMETLAQLAPAFWLGREWHAGTGTARRHEGAVQCDWIRRDVCWGTERHELACSRKTTRYVRERGSRRIRTRSRQDFNSVE